MVQSLKILSFSDVIVLIFSLIISMFIKLYVTMIFYCISLVNIFYNLQHILAFINR